MPLTDAAALAACKLYIGDTQPLFNATNSHLAVGDSTTAFVKTQTDLQAPTNKLRKPMDPTFPKRSGNVLQFSATFTSAEANWIWNEWAPFNASTSGDMLVRKVEVISASAKPNTETWQLQADVAIAA